MWLPQGATWYEAQRWFARMWGSGDPSAEQEVQSGLAAAVQALTYRPQRPEDPEAVQPRELAEHWTALIARALDEQRFSTQALSAFMEEFQVPAKIGARLTGVELEIRSLKQRSDELAAQHSEVWDALGAAGKRASRQDRNEFHDRVEHQFRANADDRALRSEASQAYSAARSGLRSAEHRLLTLEKQHAAGRRTDSELDEAREGKRAAEEHQERAKAELDRIDRENAQRKEERRQAPTAMDEHRRTFKEMQRTSAAVQAEISEAKARAAELEAQARELRKACRRQDDFYEQKRDTVRRRDRNDQDQARQQQNEDERRRRAEKAEQLREQAFRPPGPAEQAAPQSPEVQRWLHSLRSLDGRPDPTQPPGTEGGPDST